MEREREGKKEGGERAREVDGDAEREGGRGRKGERKK